MITHTPLVASNMLTKVLVARQWPTTNDTFQLFNTVGVHETYNRAQLYIVDVRY